MSAVGWLALGFILGGLFVSWAQGPWSPPLKHEPTVLRVERDPLGPPGGVRIVVRWRSGLERGFVGSGTVWRNELTGGRVGTNLEAWLADRAFAWEREQRRAVGSTR